MVTLLSSVGLYDVLGHKNTNDTSLLPVVVFVHGSEGGYQFGTGNAYDASVLSAFGEMVVVTLNYRLDILGCFSNHLY